MFNADVGDDPSSLSRVCSRMRPNRVGLHMKNQRPRERRPRPDRNWHAPAGEEIALIPLED